LRLLRRAREVPPRISEGSRPPVLDGSFSGAATGAPSLARITASNRGGMIDFIAQRLSQKCLF
jgi:hypothetical protein